LTTASEVHVAPVVASMSLRLCFCTIWFTVSVKAEWNCFSLLCATISIVSIFESATLTATAIIPLKPMLLLL